ncbi:unnamed protein product [Choristocarpus tenellus]
MFDLPGGYVACVARGPPAACCASGVAAGIVGEIEVENETLQRGLELPQSGFKMVSLKDVVPDRVWQALCIAGDVCSLEKASTAKI